MVSGSVLRAERAQQKRANGAERGGAVGHKWAQDFPNLAPSDPYATDSG